MSDDSVPQIPVDVTLRIVDEFEGRGCYLDWVQEIHVAKEFVGKPVFNYLVNHELGHHYFLTMQKNSTTFFQSFYWGLANGVFQFVDVLNMERLYFRESFFNSIFCIISPVLLFFVVFVLSCIS